jgi:hypothetical protein
MRRLLGQVPPDDYIAPVDRASLHPPVGKPASSGSDSAMPLA